MIDRNEGDEFKTNKSISLSHLTDGRFTKEGFDPSVPLAVQWDVIAWMIDAKKKVALLEHVNTPFHLKEGRWKKVEGRR